MSFFAFLLGLMVYIGFRVFLTGFFTVRPNERAVKTSFGRAQRLLTPQVDNPDLSDDEQRRYQYPQLQVIPPGGPYLKMPWQKVHKVSVADRGGGHRLDPTKAQNTIEAVTKDNLTTGVNGQIRYKVSDSNLYPYLFGVQSPLEHVMGYFVSVLRERIANFADPRGASLLVDGRGGGRRSREQRRRADRGRVDQRPAQEPPAPQRVHGAAVPGSTGGTLRHRAGRRADHRAGSAARRSTTRSRRSTPRATRSRPTSRRPGRTRSSRSP